MRKKKEFNSLKEKDAYEAKKWFEKVSKAEKELGVSILTKRQKRKYRANPNTIPKTKQKIKTVVKPKAVEKEVEEKELIKYTKLIKFERFMERKKMLGEI